MVLLGIPLVGTIDVSEDCLHVIGMVALGQTVEVDPELYGILVRQKFKGRYHSINDVIRIQNHLAPLRKPVKRFSDEGEEDGSCITA